MSPDFILCAALVAFAPSQAKPLPPATRTLEIKVLSEQDKPIPEATVRVFSQPFKVMLTDPDGVARIPDLKPGAYRVNAAKGGFRLAETTVTLPETGPASVELHLKAES